MFKSLVRKRMKTCWNSQDYIQIRELLKQYGVEKIYQEIDCFENGKTSKKDPFARMICGELLDQFVDIGDFIIVTPPNNPYHKLLTPKILEQEYFNILTLSSKDIPLLEKMKEIALNYVNIDNYGLYFHCYPFNTVYCLHLHIVDLDKEPLFNNKINNLNIDDVINVLKM